MLGILRISLTVCVVSMAIASSAAADESSREKVRDCWSKHAQIQAEWQEFDDGEERLRSLGNSLDRQSAQLDLSKSVLQGFSDDSMISRDARDRYKSDVQRYNRDVAEYNELLRMQKAKQASGNRRVEQFNDTCRISVPHEDVEAVCGDSTDDFCTRMIHRD